MCNVKDDINDGGGVWVKNDVCVGSLQPFSSLFLDKTNKFVVVILTELSDHWGSVSTMKRITHSILREAPRLPQHLRKGFFLYVRLIQIYVKVLWPN